MTPKKFHWSMLIIYSLASFAFSYLLILYIESDVRNPIFSVILGVISGLLANRGVKQIRALFELRQESK